MNLQPTHLHNALVSLRPLSVIDFESLYAVASDPLIWEQHPNPDRYKRDVFQNYFKGAVESGGAFIVLDQHEQVIGSTRFYDFDPAKSEIKIGYTFFARSCWGQDFNRSTKLLMLSYAFEFVNRVLFHVGASNIRSQKAMEKLGAIKIGEEEVAYYGEATRLNFVYQFDSFFQR
ncbi:MAG: GNAT family N-acetyltransferase [Bacteroidetes bacterium]|nr:GNAT family N-acetyltransferase [Bacteroidota bacterium]